MKKRCTAFILSDFMDIDETQTVRFEDALKIAARKHDVVALRVYDHREADLPKVGIMELQDAETGKIAWVDTSRKSVRRQYGEWWRITTERLNHTLMRCRVDNVSINTGEDYVKPLIRLFKQRV